MEEKRQRFLEVFLASLGAKLIQWQAKDENSIFGTVIYDISDMDERQDFVWHMREEGVPNQNVIDLLTYLTQKHLLDIDELKVPVTEIEIPNVDKETKEKTFDELFKVKVSMIDGGRETDHYFIHD